MQPLSRDDLTDACEMLACSEHQLKAVIEVECAGSGFDKQGRIRCLFEPHIFERQLRACHADELIDDARDARLCSPRWDRSLYWRDPHAQLEAAMAFDIHSALKSTSWGLGQVMGFNHAACGFPDVISFVEAMESGEGAQLLAMASFIAGNRRMAEALRAEDWDAFATRYNGPGHSANRYVEKLTAAAEKHEADPEAFWSGRHA